LSPSHILPQLHIRSGQEQEHAFNMADEAMAAPTSGAPPAATDHEFSSHQEQPVNHVPMHNTSRKSTLSKSYLDVHVTGTQTPMSGHRHAHSHMGDIALENYFVRLNWPPERKRRLRLDWTRKQMLIGRKGRTSRYGRSFQTPLFLTNAWECYA
jgi:hypothetical protein